MRRMFAYGLMAAIAAFCIGTYYSSIRLGMAVYMALGIVALALNDIVTEIKKGRDGLPK